MKNYMLYAALLIVAPLTLAACGQRQATPTPESLGNELFEQHCQACHGANLKGGLKIGSATSADIRWSALKQSYGSTALVERAILQGLDENGDPLDSAMPRWQGKLNQKQVQEIIAFLKTK